MKQKAPWAQKNEGESVRAVERSDRRGLGNTFPNQTEGAVWAQKNEGEGAVARERSDRKGLGKPFPNQTEGAVWAQKNEGLHPHFFVPKAGLEPARLFKDIGF